MRTAISILFCLLSLAGQSQKVIDVDKTNVNISSSQFYTVGGEPISTAKYVRVVEGSPFFSESWMRGKIMMSKGGWYDSILLRLDLVENALHYLTPGGKEMITTSDIKSIVLSDSVLGNDYAFVNSLFLEASGKIEAGWYQLLATGQASLFKRIVKNIIEGRPYGSATVEQKIITSFKYFIRTGTDFTAIKKFKDLPGLLISKKNELEVYISSNNLSGKTDADYIALITYYNSLVGK